MNNTEQQHACCQHECCPLLDSLIQAHKSNQTAKMWFKGPLIDNKLLNNIVVTNSPFLADPDKFETDLLLTGKYLLSLQLDRHSCRRHSCAEDTSVGEFEPQLIHLSCQKLLFNLQGLHAYRANVYKMRWPEKGHKCRGMESCPWDLRCRFYPQPNVDKYNLDLYNEE